MLFFYLQGKYHNIEDKIQNTPQELNEFIGNKMKENVEKCRNM